MADMNDTLALCSSELLQKTVDAFASAAFVVERRIDGAFQCIAFNQHAEFGSGLSREEILNRSPDQIFPPEEARALEEHYRECLETQNNICHDARLTFPSGKICRRIVLMPMTAPDGRVARILGVADRITFQSQYRQWVQRDIRRLLAYLPEAALLINSDEGRVAAANPAAVAFFGRIDENELIGLSIIDLVVPDEQQDARQRLKRFWQTRDKLPLTEQRFRLPSGETACGEVALAPMPGDDDEHPWAIVTIRDSSQRLAAEQALLDSEHLTRVIFDAAATGVITIDENGIIDRFNAAAEKMFGYAAAEVHGQSVAILMPDHHKILHCEYIRQYLLTAQAQITGVGRDVIGRRKNGDQFPIFLAVNEFRWRGQRMFAGTVVDQTNLKELHNRLEVAEHRLRQAILNINEGFAIWGAERQLILCNPQYRKMYSAIEDILIPGVFFEEIMVAAIQRGLFDTNLRPSEDWAREWRRIHYEGGVMEQRLSDGRWLLLSKRLTENADLVGIQADITVLKTRELDLVETQGKLERLAKDLARLARHFDEARRQAVKENIEKTRFLSHMSHELRSPLNAILGFSEIMIGEMFGPIGSSRYLQYIKDIHQSANHLLLLINDILDLSKIEAGKMEIRPERLQPQEIISACLSMVKAIADERDVKLHTHCASENASLYADRRAAKQILLNLLSNAVKFTHPGGVVRLEMTFSVEGATLITVSDTGIGMTPEQVQIAMKPFEQIDSFLARQHQGTGLGLPIVMALVELHGGQFDIQSLAGQGTTVHVRFPPPPPNS
ncbi:two-component system, cell cycle sensor histidine kinase PleC [Azospirillaceae bacterium]